MRILSKIILVLFSLFIGLWVSIEEYTYYTPIYSSYDNDGRLTAGFINLLGSPLPWLYAYGTYLTIGATSHFFIAMFTKKDTTPIINNLLKKTLITSVLLVVTLVLNVTLNVGYPQLAIGGIVILSLVYSFLAFIDAIYKNKKAIWHFFVNH